MSKTNNLTIELTNLSSGSIRIIKHELKTLIEDYAFNKMIRDNVKVTEGE